MAVEWKGDQVVDAVRRGLSAGTLIAAHRVVDVAVRKVNEGPRTGIKYPRPGGTVHQASAPGEPPKTDYGALVQSAAVRPAPDGISALAGFHTEYAAKLEIGTENFPARPYLRDSLEQVRSSGEIQRICEDEIRRILGGG